MTARYIVKKTLVLEFECEAASAEEAVDMCIEEDDTEFAVLECDYEAEEVDDETSH